MAVQAIAWAFKCEVNPSEKLVLLALANNMNPNGDCFPSVASICADTSLGERTVRACLRSLDGRFIRVQKQRSKSGQAMMSRYELFLEKTTGKICQQEENQQANIAQPTGKSPQNQQANLATIYKDQPLLEPLTNRRARQIPPDFTLTPERLEAFKAIAGDLDPVAEFEHFTDHHRSVGKPYKDWDACWRNWARNAVKFSRKPHAENQRSLSAPDRVRAANAKREAERNAAARNRGVLVTDD